MADPVTTSENFPEANSKLLPPQGDAECVDLLTWKGEMDGGRPTIISKFRLSWAERWSALRHGVAYVWVSARHTHPPIGLSIERTPFNPCSETHSVASDDPK